MSSNSTVVALLCTTTVVVVSTIWLLRKKKDETTVTITLPSWTRSEDFYNREYKTDEDRMALAIELSRKNVSYGTGGPFGCAIFEKCSAGKFSLAAIGINQVVPLSNSTLHGETVAIQMAQKKLNTYSLRTNDSNNKTQHQYELYTSCEPCCMCLGATLWSGVSRIVCAATKHDAAAIGFDEGPIFEESYTHLKKAGIDVKRGVLQKEAKQVLQDYAMNGVIYNR